MVNRYVLAIDQGTSSTKTLIMDGQGRVAATASEPLRTLFLPGGFVEQDPHEIYRNVLASVRKCVDEFERGGGSPADIEACGIANQRETFVVWDREGRPLYNAVVWQCKRSIAICKELSARGSDQLVNTRTGLVIDPYFSGTKMMWLYRHQPDVMAAVDAGDAFFGTIDTWLLYRLTDGSAYATDHTNASRTLFFNLETLDWDRDLMDHFGLSRLNLPAVQASAATFGRSTFEAIFPKALPIAAMIGDSHAAAFGEGCITPGTAKATLGTGCSVLMNVGQKPLRPAGGMVTTICWSTPARVDYAFEGVIVSCGSTMTWLRDALGLVAESADSERLATSVATNNGVYLVPAFSGLGAPYWQMDRKASITGLTFDCNKAHIVRAALEAIGYQLRDVTDAMVKDSTMRLTRLSLNGGLTSNRFVLAFVAALVDAQVVKSITADASARGAGMLAALTQGIIASVEEAATLAGTGEIVVAGDLRKQSKEGYEGWKEAIASYFSSNRTE